MPQRANFWPLEKKVSKEKNIDKAIFYLNDYSSFDPKYSQFRFIMKGEKCLRPTEIANRLGVTRKTVYRILDALKESGFLIEDKDRFALDPGAMYFKYFPDSYNKDFIYDLLPRDSLPILFYLANNFLYFTKKKKLKSYTFSQGQLIRNVWGLDSDNNSSAHNKVRGIISFLMMAGYIEVDSQKIVIGQGSYYNMTGFNVHPESIIENLPIDEKLVLSSVLCFGEEYDEQKRTFFGGTYSMDPNDF